MSKLTDVAWREIFPWLILLRTFRLAISAPILMLATLGALLTPLGWWAADVVLLDEEQRDPYFATVLADNAQWPDVVVHPERLVDGPLRESRWAHYANVPAVYVRFVQPFLRLGDLSLSFRHFLYFALGGLWNVAVWAFLAAAITRIAAVQLGRDERVGLGEALRHARRYYGWYLVAPFFPMLGVVLTMMPMALLGLLMRLSAGVFLAGVLWPLVLVGGFVIAVLLVGLMFGWPLMWPTLSSEESCDAFEAFSRSYSYTFQRPLHYLGYAIVVLLFGALGWLLVSLFAQTVVQLAVWGIAWGVGAENLLALRSGPNVGLAWSGVMLIEFFNMLVVSVAAGFNYSYFFCAATAVYLLLRRQVDQTELDEVFVEEEAQRYGLPSWQPAAESQPG